MLQITEPLLLGDLESHIYLKSRQRLWILRLRQTSLSPPWVDTLSLVYPFTEYVAFQGSSFTGLLGTISIIGEPRLPYIYSMSVYVHTHTHTPSMHTRTHTHHACTHARIHEHSVLSCFFFPSHPSAGPHLLSLLVTDPYWHLREDTLSAH